MCQLEVCLKGGWTINIHSHAAMLPRCIQRPQLLSLGPFIIANSSCKVGLVKSPDSCIPSVDVDEL